MALETNRRRIVRRLKREGWIEVHGGRHDKFEHPEWPGVVIVVLAMQKFLRV
jgi:predicted RNA binding protein YcfA (HicA-like mRNA interferase family)